MAKKADNDTIKSLIGEEKYDNMFKLFNETNKDSEYEAIFFSKKGKYLSQEKYINILKYIRVIKDIYKYDATGPTDTLDVTYNDQEGTTIRASIEGTQLINQYMKKVELWKNHVILGTFVKLGKEKDKNITLMKKLKTIENTVDVDDLDFRVRLSKELPLTTEDIEKIQSLSYTERSNIVFRLKQRVSLYIRKTDVDFVRLDITVTKTAVNFRRLNKTVPSYELEIEYGLFKEAPKKEAFEIFAKEIEKMLKVVFQTNYLMNQSKTEEVLAFYRKVLSTTESMSLDARQPISLEIQHVTEILPDKYAVTDKADGERYFLIIMNSHVYMISTNLNVRDTGIVLKNKDYDGTVMDGEYIFIPKLNRHLFMVFDCLFNGSNDVRKESNILKRLEHADNIIQNCFIFGKQKGVKIPEIKTSKKEFDLDEIAKYHEESIKKYMDMIDEDINIEKQFPLIRRKYFVPVLGAKRWEIFKYASIIWNKYTSDSNVKCPYLLDGLIFHPLEQPYVTSTKESKLSEYKWKPPEKNSVDFYVVFEKDKDTGNVVSVFDNSIDEFVKNKPYKICKLYVGKRVKGKEQPTLFMENEDTATAYLFVDNGEVRDIDGNIITDETVVEFYYNNDPDISPRFRWVPIRTRYDKTESVLRFGRKYGNYIDVAAKVWRSIVNPILMSDFVDLSKGNDPKKSIYTFDKKIDSLRAKIGHELIVSVAKENIYYQKRTNLGKDMRQFHNWIKSNLIYTLCHPMYQNNKQLSVFDIACGRGGDNLKFYHAKVAFYVGIDIDLEGLTSAVDGAISRYNQMRKNKPGFPKMYFIQADAGGILNSDEQTKILRGMSAENKQLIDKFFPKNPKERTLFDRINCQFAIHYFFKDPIVWSNFKQNINSSLRNGGYLLATTFDARSVIEALESTGTGVFSVDYTDEKGKSSKLFEIVKKFDTIDLTKPLPVGLAIDLYTAWLFAEGTYVTEYLVDHKFIIQDLLESCDLELVDTDLFKNQYELHRDYFTNFAKYEENQETKGFLSNVIKFYDKNEMNDGLLKYNNLMRYYVFRKKDSQNKTQKGGYDFTNTQEFFVPDMNGYKDVDHTLMNCFHHILRSHSIIPKTIRVHELYKDVGINMLDDVEVNTEDIKNICKKLLIQNEIAHGDNIKKHNFTGTHAIIIERDCNDEYEHVFVAKGKISKNDKVVILMKEGNLYKPVYRIDEDGKRKGLFKMSEKFIVDLLDE